MPDLTAPARSPETPKRAFELLLLAAASFEMAHLIGLFDRRAEVDGTAMAVAFTFGLPWLPLLLGLAVTRRRSAFAKWLLLALIAIALLTAWRIGVADWGKPAMFLGAIAGALQAAAGAMLLTLGRSWTRKHG